MSVLLSHAASIVQQWTNPMEVLEKGPLHIQGGKREVLKTSGTTRGHHDVFFRANTLRILEERQKSVRNVVVSRIEPGGPA